MTAFDTFRGVWTEFQIERQGDVWVITFDGGTIFCDSKEQAEDHRDLCVAHAWLTSRREKRAQDGADAFDAPHYGAKKYD